MRTLLDSSRLNHILSLFAASVALPLALAAVAYAVTVKCLVWSVAAAVLIAVAVAFLGFALSVEVGGERRPIDLKDHAKRLLVTFLGPVVCITASLQFFRSFAATTGLVASSISGMMGLLAFLILAARLFPGSRPPSTFRGRKMIDFREAQRQARKALPKGDPGILWGGLRIPSYMATKMFAVFGIPGGGKTLTIRFLMQSALPAIVPGSDVRSLIYDAKQEILGILAGMGLSCEIVILNPFDARCAAWDIAKDVTGPAIARQVATILIAEEKNASQPFFTDAARHLLYGVMLAFILKGVDWTFADVAVAMQSRRRIEQVLASTPETQEILDLYFGVEERVSDIIATVGTKLAPFESIAACWQRAETKVSLREWLEGEFILVLGNDEGARNALQAINQVIFKRVSELILSQTESEDRRTWIFLDEARQAGKLDGLGSLMTNGRSKGTCLTLGFQDIEGLRDVYGDKVANEIVGQCSSVAVLRLASPATAKFASDLFGPYEQMEKRTSESSSKGASGSSSGSTKSEQLARRDAILTSQFFDIPTTNPKNGLTGYYLQPEIGAYRATLSGAWIEEHLCKPDGDVPNFLPRPEGDQYLRAWTAEDLKRLGLETRAAPDVTPPRPAAKRGAGRQTGNLKDLKGFGQEA